MANAVYVAWNAFRAAIHCGECSWIEKIVAVMAGELEAMANVGRGFFERECLERRHDGDALQELRQLGLLEFGCKLGLAGQNDLEQFAVRGFEIREKANCLENSFAQILRLIDDEDKLFALNHLVEEDFVQSPVHGDQAHACGIDADLVEEVLHEFEGIALCLKEVSGARGLRHLLDELIEQSCLSHAGLGDQSHEAAATENAIAE